MATEFTSEDILGVITDEGNNSSLLEDLKNLYESFGEDFESEDADKWLRDITLSSKLDDANLMNIFNLIPDGSIYEFTSSKLDDSGVVQERRDNAYIKNPNHNLLTIKRAVTAMISAAIDEPIIIDEDTTEYAVESVSGMDYYAEYNEIEPGFVISSGSDLNSPVGFFPKYFPDDEHIKFDFNINDENMFCVFSALFKQSDKLYQLCKLNKPTNEKEERDFYMELLHKCKINVEEVFAITEENVARVYRLLAAAFKFNANITYFYIKKNLKAKPNSITHLGHRTIKLESGTNEPLKLVVAKLKNHIFNINNIKTKRKDALVYLQYVANVYDELKNRKLRSTIKEVTKLSREHAKEFSKYQKEKIANPEELLKDICVDDCCYLPEVIPETNFTDPNKVKYVPFIFDFETVLNSKNEHIIYSYVIKKVNSDKMDLFYNHFPFEPLTERTNPLVKLFNFVINNTEKDERGILLAHNGAKFDNLLCLKLACETYGMNQFREINAGPNNDIMMSLDITYSYKLKSTDTKCQSKVISFRDSYKLLDCKAADIPANYGTKAFKLPYCYEIYNQIFKITENNTGAKLKVSDKSQMKYKMTNYFSSKSNNKFILKSGKPDEKMIVDYEKMLNGELTDLSPLLQKEIEEYKNKLAKKKVYYLPEEYCKLYNKYDVLVVEEGLLKMQYYIRSLGSIEAIFEMMENSKVKLDDKRMEQLKEKVKQVGAIPATKDLDIFQYRSLASMVFDIAKKSGVFNDIYVVTGNLKTFLQLSVVGGRVMKNPNKELNDYKSKFYEYFMQQVGKESTEELNKEILNKAILDSIIDNDAVSLYPSAISLCRMPAGKPEVVTLNETQSDCFIKLIPKILRSGRTFFCVDIETQKDLEFPILSEKDDNGIRRFRNGKFRKIVIGDVTLSDAIKYQNAKVTRIYAIVRFDRTCDRFAQFIKKLFTLRLIFKAMKLPCQNTVKLMMNSSYGRTILKQSPYKKIYKRVYSNEDKEKFRKYIDKNYFYLKPEINKIGNYVKLNKRELTFNPSGYPHVGSHILEMSKMLMNKMFYKIYENGLAVYYTDTDSIHVQASSLLSLGDMLGEEMTQFHSDFGEVGYRGVYCKELGNANPGIFAIRSVFVMKKCYYDKLFCINNETNKYEIIEHKRVKGIASAFMNEERYEKLLNGSILECDMCEYRDLIMRKTKDGVLITIDKFKRTISQTD